MTRHRLMLLVLLVLALAVAGCGDDDEEAAEDTTAAATTEAASGGGGTTLSGSVGPGFDISLDAEGLTAGDYTLVVNDQSSSHNFHLTGPSGVDVSTSVGDEGEMEFPVTLEAGEYTFVCDPHASQMRGTFTVG